MRGGQHPNPDVAPCWHHVLSALPMSPPGFWVHVNSAEQVGFFVSKMGHQQQQQNLNLFNLVLFSAVSFSFIT